MSFVLLGILNSQAAAGGGSAFDLLETTVLSTTTASITFANLNNYSSYKHLQIRAVTKDDAGTDNLNRLDMRFNNDTTANYAYHYLNGNGTALASSSGTSQTAMQFFDVIGGGNNQYRYGAIVIDILDFSNTNKYKTVRGLGGGIVLSEQDISLSSNLWKSTSAITEIDIFGNFNYASGSRFSLYGIKG